MMSKILFINTIILSAIFLAGCTSNEEGDFEVAFDNKIEHIHGIGYAGETNGLYFATHGGLKIYCDSEGYETTRNYNDYMGFNAVDKGFYTSGHPGGDSDIPNPFGIQRSFDGDEPSSISSLKGKLITMPWQLGMTATIFFS